MEKKLLLLCAVVLLFSSALVFATGGGEKAGTAGSKWSKTLEMSFMMVTTAKPAVEDAIASDFSAATGVKINMRNYPADAAGTNVEASMVAQTLIAANDIPAFFGAHIIPPNEEAVKLLVDKNYLWEFSEANLKKYMPKFVARMNKYGDLATWLEQEKRYQGKNWAMSNSMPAVAFSKLAKVIGEDSQYLVDRGWPAGATYGMGLRDDIMKQIFPNSLTVAELGEKWVKNNGKIDPKDAYADVPINSLDDLTSYLKKVKNIIDTQNLKVGADKMIVGIPWCTTCGSGDTLGWSFSTFYGYSWNEPPWYVVDPEPKAYYVFSQDSFKTGLKWANEAFNQGLIDPEVFIKKGDEAQADVNRGRYGVIMSWQVGSANNAAKDNNYPWRYRQISGWFADTAHGATSILKGPFEDISNFAVTYHTHSGLLMTKTVKEADLAQAFNYVDWSLSDEADVLRNWGPASFYTGTGKDRRFKPEYKAIEDQKVYNISSAGAKDAYYYGIPWGTPNMDSTYIDYAKSPTFFFGDVYPESPMYVYPHKAAITDDYQALIYGQWLNGQRKKINFYPMVGWSAQNDLLAIPDFARIRYLLFPKSATEISVIIRGSTADFEANWAHMRKVQEDEGLQNAMDQVSAKWKEIYNKNVKQYWKHDVQ